MKIIRRAFCKTIIYMLDFKLKKEKLMQASLGQVQSAVTNMGIYILIKHLSGKHRSFSVPSLWFSWKANYFSASQYISHCMNVCSWNSVQNYCSRSSRNFCVFRNSVFFLFMSRNIFPNSVFNVKYVPTYKLQDFPSPISLKFEILPI